MSHCAECFDLGLASVPCPRCGRWRTSAEVAPAAAGAAAPITAEELTAIEARARAAPLDTKLWSLSPVGAATAEECDQTAEFVEAAKGDVLRLATELRRVHAEFAERGEMK